jgi:hypothetical protein
MAVGGDKSMAQMGPLIGKPHEYIYLLQGTSHIELLVELADKIDIVAPR